MTSRLRNWSVLVALIGFLVLALGAFVDPRRAAFGYLVAYAFAATIALSGLAFLMMGHVTHASWIVAIRRVLEAIAGTVPLFAVLFVPIVLSAKLLYPWADDPTTWSPHVAHAILVKRAWLSLPFFAARAGFYFALWTAFALLLRRWSLRGELGKQRALSGAALPAMGLTFTFATFDWMMSTDPAWQSNAYGVYVFSGGFLACLSLVAILSYFAQRYAILETTPSRTHAIGNLMLGMTVFWAYIAFTQFLIIWIADLPEEVGFFQVRSRGAYLVVSVFLVVGHFVLPLLCLLMRGLKRRPVVLAAIGAWLLVAHFLDVFWLLVPVVRPEGPGFHWVDLGALLAVGGLAVAYGASRFTAASFLPKDPALAEAMRFEMP
jgi:hypothetical protein